MSFRQKVFYLVVIIFFAVILWQVFEVNVWVAFLISYLGTFLAALIISGITILIAYIRSEKHRKAPPVITTLKSTSRKAR